MMSENLPRGWTKTTLGQIAFPLRDRALPTDFPDMRYVGLENIEPHTMKLLSYQPAADVRSSSFRFSRGNILYGRMRPYLNKVWLAEFDGLCSAEIIVLSVPRGVVADFLTARISGEDFVKFANTTTAGERPRANFDKLANFPIHLPPTEEQERIASKLHELLSSVDRAESAAQRAKIRLESYKSAVLEAALTGQLTAQWREKRTTQGVVIPDGETLLNDLLTRRREYWETNTTRRTGKDSIKRKPKQSSRYPSPLHLPVNTEGNSLPEGWAFATIDQLCFVVRGASPRPAGDPRYFGGEIPWITVGSLTREPSPYLIETAETLTEAGKEASRFVETDTLLLTNSGATLGVPKITKIAGCINDGVAALLGVTSPLSLYMYYFLCSQTQRLRDINQGAAQPNLNTDIIRGIVLPVPPLSEQLLIITEVERRLAAADKLSNTLNHQASRARATRQLLMAEAFSGRLVPQTLEATPVSLPSALADHKVVATHKRVVISRPSQIRRTILMPAADISSADSLGEIWTALGSPTDALLFFTGAGFGNDQVVQFYEALRANPTIRRAFQQAAETNGPAHSQATQHAKEKKSQTPERFRLMGLWLEDFKNLKDYAVHFNPSQGLDVVLGWNGTGKSNLFEALVIVFRDLYEWWEKNKWPDKPLNAFRLTYEISGRCVQVHWDPRKMKRPELFNGPCDEQPPDASELSPIKREQLVLPSFVFGYYSGPTNRLAEHFLPMKQAHYVRLREADSDDAFTLARILEQRRFFCAETHHAKYVLLAFSYKEDPKIKQFLESRLRIVGFESALFIIRKPRWAKKGTTAEDFWGATGIMLRVLQRLRGYAVAPMILKQNVSHGYRSSKEDHYYFFLPDHESLSAFAAEYEDARTFFLALESTDFSELIHDVKIQVKVKATEGTQVPITFHQLSEGEQQLLMVLGLLRFTKSNQSLVLLDEPDTHLNPHWSVKYLSDLSSVMSDDSTQASEQQSSQILMATHDPLVIAGLVKEQIHLLKRDLESLKCYSDQPSEDPKGLGFTGILTSDIFGFRSDLDSATMELLDQQAALAGKDQLNKEEARRLSMITEQVEKLGFKSASSDPYYRAFIRAIVRHRTIRNRLQKPVLNKSDIAALEKETDEILSEIEAEEAKAR